MDLRYKAMTRLITRGTKYYEGNTIRRDQANRERLFRDTVFGKWLDIQSHENDRHLMHYVLQHRVFVSNLRPDCPPIIFHIGDHCELVFMGKEKRTFLTKHIMWLVDDFDAWNAFPWGEYMWEKFYQRTVNAVYRHTEHHLAALKKNPNFNATYNLYEFDWAFKIWILKSYPNSQKWYSKKANVTPHGLSWSKVTTFEKSDYDRLFGPLSNSIVALISSPEEMRHAWFMASVDFIKGLGDQDGNFLQDDEARVNSIEHHNGIRRGDGVLNSKGDGVHLSQTNDVLQQAVNRSTISSTSPQARNAAAAEFFVEFDPLKNFTDFILYHPSSSSSHPGNDEDASHFDDLMEIDGENAKDGYSNSQHHLHLLIKALESKTENPIIDLVVPPKDDDRILRPVKPNDACDEVEVDNFDDDYMLMMNDEEKHVKSSLNDMKLEQEPDKISVKQGILDQPPTAEKGKQLFWKKLLGLKLKTNLDSGEV
nr:phospholipase-like protein [Tanacetum cinerariifolium]